MIYKSNKINKNILNITLSVSAVFILSACSGDSDTQAVETPLEVVEIPLEAVETTPAIEYDCVAHYTEAATEYNPASDELVKVSANGAFKIVCEENDYSYAFASEINELSITNVVATINGNLIDTDETSKYLEVVNLAEGTEHFSGTYSLKGSFDCVNTYDVAGTLPRTIYDANRISNIFFLENDYQLLSTTCPDWMNDENTEYGDHSSELTVQQIVTDTFGQVSTLNFYIKKI